MTDDEIIDLQLLAAQTHGAIEIEPNGFFLLHGPKSDREFLGATLTMARKTLLERAQRQMLVTDRFNEIIARRGELPSEDELQAVSNWLVDYFSRTRHGGEIEGWAARLGVTVVELGERFDELMREIPDYPSS
ncbi:hypothetical protein [Paracoccus methylarcula]|uniref:Uncharacterized protein n=1 Tax=Paracoccus methylarcula TaxID=72022 RepID=A0A422R1G9_9RHOB|nr:hypothetical protein [Paracoccus methylarcula]RNF36066.1 hypothetical protein A7A09_001275 [Paracoccus methylarcula]